MAESVRDVLGVPVRFTAPPEVLAAVAAASTLVATPSTATPAVHVRLALEEPVGPAGFLLDGDVLHLGAPGCRGSADAAAGFAEASLEPALLHDRERFEQGLLATLVLFLVTRHDRQPLHAAAIARHDRTVLLCGRAGSGKSTLAFAALQDGWDVLTDDAVYLQSRPELRIWTRPPRLHLRPEASQWFPQLAGLPLVQRENGTMKLRVEPATTSQPRTGAAICLLRRSDGAPVLERVTAGAALQELEETMEPGFDRFRASIRAPLRQLLANGAWRLHTGTDPRAAAALLQHVT